MPYTTQGKNFMLDALASEIANVAVYDGDPESGGTELDRQSISFNSSAGGVLDSFSGVTLSISTGETVRYVGFLNLSDALLAKVPLDAPVSFTKDGYYTLQDADLDLNT